MGTPVVLSGSPVADLETPVPVAVPVSPVPVSIPVPVPPVLDPVESPPPLLAATVVAVPGTTVVIMAP